MVSPIPSACFGGQHSLSGVRSPGTGAIGGDLSHEFQVIADTGESAIFYDAAFDDIRSGKTQMTTVEMRKLYAAADEKHKPDACSIPGERLLIGVKVFSHSQTKQLRNCLVFQISN